MRGLKYAVVSALTFISLSALAGPGFGDISRSFMEFSNRLAKTVRNQPSAVLELGTWWNYRDMRSTTHMQGVLISGAQDQENLYVAEQFARAMFQNKKPYTIKGENLTHLFTMYDHLPAHPEFIAINNSPLLRWLEDSAGGKNGGVIILDQPSLANLSALRGIYHLMSETHISGVPLDKIILIVAQDNHGLADLPSAFKARLTRVRLDGDCRQELRVRP